MVRWEIEESGEMVAELFEKLALPEGSLCVVGCSTSEVLGNQIGKGGSMDVAKGLFEALKSEALKRKISLAFQCCEHLNRALVVEKEVAISKNWIQVAARPVGDAGGAMATVAWEAMSEPTLVAQIQADAGIDIGQTFIGMHLRQVAVPIRLSRRYYGSAVIGVAKSRLPLIGGVRTQYS